MQKVISKLNGKAFKLIVKNKERVVLMNDKGIMKSMKPRSYSINYIEIDKEGDNE